MTLDNFKKLAAQIAELEKTGLSFNVTFKDQNWQKDFESAVFEPTFVTINTIDQLASIIDKTHIPLTWVHQNYGHTPVQIPYLKPINCMTVLPSTKPSVVDDQKLRNAVPTIKYWGGNSQIFPTDMTISYLSADPVETISPTSKETFRTIANANSIQMCVPATDPRYIFLDKHHILFQSMTPMGVKTTFMANELTPDVLLVAQLANKCPTLIKQFQEGFFINSAAAKVLRVKGELLLKKEIPRLSDTYEQHKRNIYDDYERTANSNIIGKLVDGTLKLGVFNRIKVTKDSANYENAVTLEYPDLFKILKPSMVFDDRTDIYNIVQTFIEQRIKALDSQEIPVPAEGEEATVVTDTFIINGINIEIGRSSANTRRKVNGVYINKDELPEVCYRASCLHDQVTFDKFVASVHKMSLKWHNAIGDGIPVKIHPHLTKKEYSKPTPPISAPRIRFRIDDDGVVYVVTGKEDADRVPIKLNKIIDKLATINRRTNNSNDGLMYSPRNSAWACREIAKALKECCTFTTEKVLIVDNEKKPILKDGKRQYTKVDKCMITDEQANFVTRMSNEAYDKAVIRSKSLLDNAVAQTGAKTVQFQGKECWYVEGRLHKYAIEKTTNRVFNFEKGNAICIVEPGHRVEVGFDATVSRILALKNDAVTVGQISTLRNA